MTFLVCERETVVLPGEAAQRDRAGTDASERARARDVIQRRRGSAFATSGGWLAAVFWSAGDAVDAACEIQRGVLVAGAMAPGWLRIGVNTGEATEHDGAFVGPEVDRAVRLAAIAHGGQILLSDTTEAMIRGRVTLRLLGDYRLGGPRRRAAVFQLIAEGLPSEFPPLRSVGPRAGNLPVPSSSFIGRDQVMVDSADLVRSNRLVTLCGVGGVGKTRLAIELAAEMSDEFPDGMWLVELAPVADPGAVTAAVAAALGVTPQDGAALVDTVADALGGRRLLLLIDNCEHVLGPACATLERILAVAGDSRVVATSRERLGLTGEAVFAVPPLALDGGAASDAVALFAERARSVRPGFGLQDRGAADAVIEICATLDGIPLAIELAAARMVAMSAVEVRDRLADRFRLFRSVDGRPERQQTLRNAVGWSYELLHDAEREVLRNASVFAGGFDLAAIIAVTDDADEVDLLGRLDSLVSKSLVLVDQTEVSTRYSTYETIRQFAEEQLAASDELVGRRDRHATHFAGAAVTRWEGSLGPGWRAAADWLETELANLRAAFRWSVQRGATATATDLAAHSALLGFSVQLFETVEWAEELLPSAAASAVRRLPRLYTAAGYACFVGRAQVATTNAHRATELEAQPQYEACEPGYATFIEALGQVYCGNLDRYIELTATVAARSGSNQAYGIAAYLDGLQSAGRIDEALALTDDAIAAARRLGHPYWIAYTLWIVGLAYSKVDAKRALLVWDEAAEFVRQHRVRFFEGFIGRDAGRLHTAEGEPEAALALFGPAMEAFQRAGNVPQLIITLASVPALFARVDRFEAAATLLGALALEPSSAHHVPELVEVGDRVRARLGAGRYVQCTQVGATLDRNEAVAYARRQIELARRDLIERAQQGPPGGLTRREIDVLRLVAEGRTTQEIAERLFISAKTADSHIQHIYLKIVATNRATATRWALEHGLVGEPLAT